MNTDKVNRIRFWGAGLAGVILAGCLVFAGLPVSAQEPAAEESGKQAPGIAETLEDDAFHYESSGRRDPFKSLMVLQEKQKDFSMLPPIQQIDIASIAITGIVLDESQGPRAMIKADGKSFVVKKGMIVGRNEGEVTEVTLQGIRIVEKFVDFMGNETLKETYIKSRPDRR